MQPVVSLELWLASLGLALMIGCALGMYLGDPARKNPEAGDRDAAAPKPPQRRPVQSRQTPRLPLMDEQYQRVWSREFTAPSLPNRPRGQAGKSPSNATFRTIVEETHAARMGTYAGAGNDRFDLRSADALRHYRNAINRLPLAKAESQTDGRPLEGEEMTIRIEV